MYWQIHDTYALRAASEMVASGGHAHPVKKFRAARVAFPEVVGERGGMAGRTHGKAFGVYKDPPFV